MIGMKAERQGIGVRFVFWHEPGGGGGPKTEKLSFAMLAPDAVNFAHEILAAADEARLSVGAPDLPTVRCGAVARIGLHHAQCELLDGHDGSHRIPRAPSEDP